MKYKIIFLLLIGFLLNPVYAAEKITNTYAHVKKKDGEVTGKTVYERTIKTDGLSVKSLNFNKEGKLTAYERYEYDSNIKLKSYSGIDYKKGFSLKVDLEGNEYKSTLKAEGSTYNYDIEDDDEIVIMWGVIEFGRQMAKSMKKGKEVGFSLFLPLGLYELSKKSLPRTLSVLSTDLTYESRQDNMLTLKISPSSFFMRKILPDDLQDYFFTYDLNTLELTKFETTDYNFVLQ